MGFQYSANLVDIRLCLGILSFHGLDSARALLEDSKDALFLLLVKTAKLLHHSLKQLAHFSQILCPHILQRRLGKIRHLLLGPSPIL